MAFTTEQQQAIVAVRAIAEWMQACPDAVPSRTMDAMAETAWNSTEAILQAHGLAEAVGAVQEEQDELMLHNDEFWPLVEAKLG